MEELQVELITIQCLFCFYQIKVERYMAFKEKMDERFFPDLWEIETKHFATIYLADLKRLEDEIFGVKKREAEEPVEQKKIILGKQGCLF